MLPRPAGAAVLRAEKTAAIASAVLQVLGERGWSGLTMDAVAARAGVGKPALYRRWPSKDAMILDCVVAAGVDAALPTDNGTLREDLLEFARQALIALRDPIAGRVIAAVLAEMSRRPDLAHQMEERFRAPRRAIARAAFERAIVRGEIDPTTDIEIATDLLAAPFYMVASGAAGAVSPGYEDRLVDAVIRSVSRRPS